MRLVAGRKAQSRQSASAAEEEQTVKATTEFYMCVSGIWQRLESARDAGCAARIGIEAECSRSGGKAYGDFPRLCDLREPDERQALSPLT